MVEPRLAPVQAGSLVALAFVGLAALTYHYLERRWRWRWQELPSGLVPADLLGAAFGSGEPAMLHKGQAPGAIRLAAFTSLLFGQLFVPGLLLAVLTFALFLGAGLVVVPGLIAAAKLHLAGVALLKREPREAYFRARAATRWAFGYHALAFAAATLFVWSAGWQLRGGYLAFSLYSALSILQARQLRRAVELHEDELFAPTARPSVCEPAPFRLSFGDGDR
jgi:hypothetical protein